MSQLEVAGDRPSIASAGRRDVVADRSRLANLVERLWWARQDVVMCRIEVRENNRPHHRRELRRAEELDRRLARELGVLLKGRDSFTMPDGVRAWSQPSIKVNFHRVRVRALRWLEANRHADVVFELRREYPKSAAARAHETQVLKAFVRRELDGGRELPLETLGITVSWRAMFYDPENPPGHAS